MAKNIIQIHKCQTIFLSQGRARSAEWAVAAHEFLERRSESGQFLAFLNATVKMYHDLADNNLDVAVNNFYAPDGILIVASYKPSNEDILIIRASVATAQYMDREMRRGIEETLLAVHDLYGLSVVKSLSNVAEWARLVTLKLRANEGHPIPRNLGQLVLDTPEHRGIKRFNYQVPSRS